MPDRLKRLETAFLSTDCENDTHWNHPEICVFTCAILAQAVMTFIIQKLLFVRKMSLLIRKDIARIFVPR